MSRSRSRILDPVFKGGGATSKKRKADRLVLVPKWHAILEWSGSELCELSWWIRLVDQSAQLSYMIIIY
jgi:hypothetical protein